ncbi:MAG: hypothetical protein Q4A92_08830 [Corynebacterium sp.]|nr:hypothetical protein [Corynebacterium sp.]
MNVRGFTWTTIWLAIGCTAPALSLVALLLKNSSSAFPYAVWMLLNAIIIESVIAWILRTRQNPAPSSWLLATLVARSCIFLGYPLIDCQNREPGLTTPAFLAGPHQAPDLVIELPSHLAMLLIFLSYFASIVLALQETPTTAAANSHKTRWIVPTASAGLCVALFSVSPLFVNALAEHRAFNPLDHANETYHQFHDRPEQQQLEMTRSRVADVENALRIAEKALPELHGDPRDIELAPDNYFRQASGGYEHHGIVYLNNMEKLERPLDATRANLQQQFGDAGWTIENRNNDGFYAHNDAVRVYFEPTEQQYELRIHSGPWWGDAAKLQQALSSQ